MVASFTGTGAQALPISYRVSNFLGASINNISGNTPRTIGYVNEPTSKIMLCEGIAGPHNQDGAGWADWDHFPYNPGDFSYATEGFASHTKGANYTFCDGHVKLMNPVDTTGINGAPNMWGCQNGSQVTSQYPACTPGDVNGDNPDPIQTQVMQALDNHSN